MPYCFVNDFLFALQYEIRVCIFYVVELSILKDYVLQSGWWDYFFMFGVVEIYRLPLYFEGFAQDLIVAVY